MNGFNVEYLSRSGPACFHKYIFDLDEISLSCPGDDIFLKTVQFGFIDEYVHMASNDVANNCFIKRLPSEL
jgi:hypothetical protein